MHSATGQPGPWGVTFKGAGAAEGRGRLHERGVAQSGVVRALLGPSCKVVAMSQVVHSVDAAERSRRLRELAALFLRLGATAFGGPAAHIAMMEDEVVTRRKWLTPEEFTDTLGIVNVIPGPNSTELAIHIGYARAGWCGLMVAGVCFIVPATLIVAAIGRAYIAYGTLPQAQGLLMGVKPVIIAVILQAVWRLARSACKNAALSALGVACIAASFLGVHELLVLAGAGALGLLLHALRSPPDAEAGTAVKSIGLPGLGWGLGTTGGTAVAAGTGAAAVAPFSLLALFLFFVKVGSVLFGSGYVLLAFLKADLVDRLHWLTEQQLLDAVAVGQVTPGPIFTTATFIGFLLGGWSGAAVATVGIFLPAFVFVALAGLVLPRLRASRWFAPVLDGLNVGSLGLMAAVAVLLAREAVVDWLTLALAVISAVLLLRFKINSAWLVLGGGAIGLIAVWLR